MTSENPVLTEARELLRSCDMEGGLAKPPPDRLGQIAAEVAATGGYRHTAEELRYGARIAWRNTVVCVGKAHWRALEVRDARSVTSSDEAFEACVEHLRYATNGGRIRLVLTALPATEPNAPGWRIWNSQLVRYAGYRRPDGGTLGDPETADFTDFAR